VGFRLFQGDNVVLQRLRAVRQNARQNQDGFTLVELLIVIIILGVLAGIVVFAVNGITDRGVNAACKSDIQTVQVASEAYFAKNSAWATDIPALVTGGFLQKAPIDGSGASDKYGIAYDNSNGAVTGFLYSGGVKGAAC
jgi:prepilin-type N-terminal cleavage/methylation domain-containing protein